jgi:hypothetical protein
MRAQLYVLVVAAVLTSVAIAHDDHKGGEQMPLGYFKYPYQATYPGDNEGKVISFYIYITGPTSELMIQSPPTPSSPVSLRLRSYRGYNVSVKTEMSHLILLSSALHL